MTNETTNIKKCVRCGKEQTPTAYCVEWHETDCIRMESITKDWHK